MAAADTLELTGILAATDAHERLRLCLVDVLEGERPVPDNTWTRLRKAVPPSYGKAYAVPYDLPLGGSPDDAGIRGECWVSLPRAAPGKRGRLARDHRARILALAAELRGKEVVLTVRPKRYSYISQARHNYGEEVAGTLLQFVTLEPKPARATGSGN